MTTTKPIKIAFQGEPGANSHIAIAEAYPDAEALPCPTFEDALAAISSGEADLGMIPIENSVAGRVAVATDSPDIAAAVTAHGGEAVMTNPDHPSGSDRIFEALEKLEQLRAIEAGMRIDVTVVDTVPRGVDTPADLVTTRQLLAKS